MPGSTDRGIVFPVKGDIMEPLAGWFAQQAASVDDAIDDIYEEFEVPEYPDPKSIQGAVNQAVTATAWADLPNAPAISLTLPRACWVTIVHGAWMASTNTSGDVRGSSSVSGATVLSESQLEVGGATTAWGQVMYTTGVGTRQQSGTRFVRLNAGENVIKLRAYGTGGGKAMNYSTLQVSPVRWA